MLSDPFALAAAFGNADLLRERVNGIDRASAIFADKKSAVLKVQEGVAIELDDAATTGLLATARARVVTEYIAKLEELQKTLQTEIDDVKANGVPIKALLAAAKGKP